jgi:hypothetical protein
MGLGLAGGRVALTGCRFVLLCFTPLETAAVFFVGFRAAATGVFPSA